MRAKFVNEAIGFERYKDPKEALFNLPKNFIKFQKAFDKLKIETDQNDFGDIGQEIGEFMGKFYDYEPPLDQEDDTMLHPMIIELIDNWLQKHKNEFAYGDEQDFWDGIASGCSQIPY